MVSRKMFGQLNLFVFLLIEKRYDFDGPGGLFNFLLLEKAKFPRQSKRPEYFLSGLDRVLLIVDNMDVVVELSRRYFLEAGEVGSPIGKILAFDSESRWPKGKNFS